MAREFKDTVGRGSILGVGGTDFSRGGARLPIQIMLISKATRPLLSIENLARSELYKLFAKIRYRVLNKDGFEVSGGERSEFRLLQEIKDAQNFDLLLIDEPESSFDNMFLRSDVNQILAEISESMPVVVVTHNSTVGASIGGGLLVVCEQGT